MFQSPRMVSYQVHDLKKARDWYSAILETAPVLDTPISCVFSIGDCSMALVPERDKRGGDSGGVVYWNVDDIDAAYRRLVEAGAESVAEITLLMTRSRIARLRDPFGNVIGIISASQKKTSVEDRPSESALTVAFFRALATYDRREEIRGPDNLAELFLADEGKKSLKDPGVPEWMIKQSTGPYEYFIARTAYGDSIFRQALRDRVPQIVCLGAGYDTRPYRFQALIEGTRVFELDALPTQQRKRQLLNKANVVAPPQLVFVSINFEKEMPAEVLSKAGFDRNQKTLFVWEGVTYYLTPEAVDATLAFIRDNSAGGSTICFDYMVQAPDMASRHGVKAIYEAWRKIYSSEHVQFGIDEGSLERFLLQRGFRLLENLTTEQIENRFLTLKDGTLAGRVLALFNIAYAETVPTADGRR